MNISQLTIKEAHAGLKNKTFSCRELTEACLDRIKRLEPQLNSFITVTGTEAKRRAAAVDASIKQGDKINVLSGLPVAVKDNIMTRGIETTAGSNILKGYRPPYTATVVSQIEKASGLIIGKANCDEFAMGASGENSAYQPTKNPWDLKRVPGGSSSGPAAAVSSGECLYALGSDTGGSVRQPAGFCNLVGLKPTYGRISRHGLISLASSLDQIGIFTKTVEDCAEVLHKISGHDKKDSTSVKKTVTNYPEQLKQKLPKLKLGVPKEFFVDGMDKEVEKVIRKALDKYSEMGYEITEISLPSTPEALAVYYLILPAEASSNLARYDGIRYGLSDDAKAKSLEEIYRHSRAAGFGPEVKRRIMLGTFVLSAGYYDAYYLKAQKVRTLIIQEYQKAFEKVDCILTPTSPTPAFKLGEKYEDPLTMYLSDIFTVSANIAGLPGISIPAGFINDLPVGLQIMAPHFEETKLLQVAQAYQNETDWHRQIPKI